MASSDQECQCACAALLRELARHPDTRRGGLIWRELRTANHHCEWTMLAGASIERHLSADVVRRLDRYEETPADERKTTALIRVFHEEIMRDVRRNTSLATWYAWRYEYWSEWFASRWRRAMNE